LLEGDDHYYSIDIGLFFTSYCDDIIMKS